VVSFGSRNNLPIPDSKKTNKTNKGTTSLCLLTLCFAFINTDNTVAELTTKRTSARPVFSTFIVQRSRKSLNIVVNNQIANRIDVVINLLT